MLPDRPPFQSISRCVSIVSDIGGRGKKELPVRELVGRLFLCGVPHGCSFTPDGPRYRNWATS